ncbi:hypothetical protein GCM10018955_70560 [Planomonospora venezuelensis]
MPQPLTQRMRGRLGLQAGDDGLRAAEVQLRPGTPLDRDETQLAEAGDLGGGPQLPGELAVGRPVPEPQRRLRTGERLLGRQGLRPGDELGEPERVEVGRGEQVPGGPPDEQPGEGTRRAPRFDGPAQVGHVGLDRGHRARRRRVAVQILDQGVGGDDGSARDQQPGEHRALARTAEPDGNPVVVVDLDRAENPEPHPYHPWSAQ